MNVASPWTHTYVDVPVVGGWGWGKVLDEHDLTLATCISTFMYICR
jgi:hypothetical protein